MQLESFLKLTPKRYLCPYCGKWHEWGHSNYEMDYYNSKNYPIELKCPIIYQGKTSFYFKDGYCYIKTAPICRVANLKIDARIPIGDMKKAINNEPKVTWSLQFKLDECDKIINCHYCEHVHNCSIYKLVTEEESPYVTIEFGLEFENSDYKNFANSEIQKSKAEDNKEEDYQQPEAENNKEALKMEKTTIWQQLYQNSPKENFETVKQLVTKYKTTLKWAIPVATIFVAYRILNSKNSALNVDNIDNECEKKLGFRIRELGNKKELKELMAFGGVATVAYATIKAISSYNNDVRELEVEKIEEGLEKLEGSRKKFGWIQPKTEKLLPIATSVIIVYMMTQRPKWFETIKTKAAKMTGDFSVKLGLCFEMAKLFVEDKFNIQNEEELQKTRKFMLLAAIVGISVLLYGKKILNKKKEAEDNNDDEKSIGRIRDFVSQLIPIMKKLMPTAFSGILTFLVTRKLLNPNDIDDIIDMDEILEENDKESNNSEEVSNENEVDNANDTNGSADKNEVVK